MHSYENAAFSTPGLLLTIPNSVSRLIGYFNRLYYTAFQMRALRKNVLAYRFRNIPFNENALFYTYYGFYNKKIRRRFYFTNLSFLRLSKYYRFKQRHLIRFKIVKIIFRAFRRAISLFVRLSLINRRLNKAN